MLLLTRKEGQLIVIETDTGEEIEIIYLKAKGQQLNIDMEALIPFDMLKKNSSIRLH